jgi:hypothetical protein
VGAAGLNVFDDAGHAGTTAAIDPDDVAADGRHWALLGNEESINAGLLRISFFLEIRLLDGNLGAPAGGRRSTIKRIKREGRPRLPFRMDRAG